MTRSLALCVALACAGAAAAAELPSRGAKSKPAEAKARACEIGGGQGVLLANGTCVRVSGYVSAGVSAGRAKH